MIENIPWDILLNPLYWLIGLMWLAVACAALLAAGFIILLTIIAASYPFVCIYGDWKRK